MKPEEEVLGSRRESKEGQGESGRWKSPLVRSFFLQQERQIKGEKTGDKTTTTMTKKAC